MKKHLLTPLTALLLLAGGLLVCGCEKEPPPPPPVVDSELVPTLELSVTPEGVIPYGEGSVVINFQTKDANQVLVNGVRKPSVKLGTHTIKEKLFKDTTLVVKAINIKKMVEKSVTIQVGDWTTSSFGLVSYYPWKYKALSVSSFEGKILDYWIPDPEPLSWVFYYHRDGKITQTIDPNRTEPWYLKNDSTLVVNGVARKLQVDQNEMVISYETRFNGEPAWFNMIFEHASDTPTDPI
ncbi:MAG: hypothetical protein PHT14_09980 [Petrimonas sp.]|nr:hypothetical protein [Petrimonas sp.]